MNIMLNVNVECGCGMRVWNAGVECGCPLNIGATRTWKTTQHGKDMFTPEILP